LGKSIACVCVADIVNHPTVKIITDHHTTKNNSYIIVPNSELIQMKYILVYSVIKNEKKYKQREEKSLLLIFVYISLLLGLIIWNFITRK